MSALQHFRADVVKLNYYVTDISQLPVVRAICDG